MGWIRKMERGAISGGSGGEWSGCRFALSRWYHWHVRVPSYTEQGPSREGHGTDRTRNGTDVPMRKLLCAQAVFLCLSMHAMSFVDYWMRGEMLAQRLLSCGRDLAPHAGPWPCDASAVRSARRSTWRVDHGLKACGAARGATRAFVIDGWGEVWSSGPRGTA